jgi:hypothetical protein
MTPLLVSWLLFAAAPRPFSAAVQPLSFDRIVAADAQRGSSSSSSTPPINHTVAIGGMVGAMSFGNGVGGRYWFLGPLGVDARVGMSSGGFGTLPSGGFSYELAASLIVMLKRPDATKGFDARPFIGAGVNHTRAGLNTTTALEPVSGAGEQFFGGVEIGIGQVPSLALGGEIDYTRRSSTLTDAGVHNGVTGEVQFFFYVK